MHHFDLQIHWQSGHRQNIARQCNFVHSTPLYFCTDPLASSSRIRLPPFLSHNASVPRICCRIYGRRTGFAPLIEASHWRRTSAGKSEATSSIHGTYPPDPFYYVKCYPKSIRRDKYTKRVGHWQWSSFRHPRTLDRRLGEERVKSCGVPLYHTRRNFCDRLGQAAASALSSGWLHRAERWPLLAARTTGGERICAPRSPFRLVRM